ncbi:MAG: histidine kinase, partial [Burkholderiales bacterium]|nr:histidine kinase [Burkholderiales bacterium]
MQEHSVLGHVALGYSPMIDRQREVVATRLTIFPDNPGGAPDAAALLRAIESVWPAESGGKPLKLDPRPLDPARVKQQVTPLVSLNLAGEDLLAAVLNADPGPQLMIEVPAFMASDPAHQGALRQLHEAGTTLLIKGRPLAPLAPEILA